MKILKRLTFMLAVVLAFGAFAGCYVVNGGKIDKVKGTYILDVFSRSYPPEEGEEEGVKHDYIKERKITEYLVISDAEIKDDTDKIRGFGQGYIVRKEGDKEIFAAKITLTFEYDNEEEENINYVGFKGSVTGQDKFAVNTKKLFGNVTLNKTLPNVFQRGYTDTFKYKKLNAKADLSYVTKKLGEFTFLEETDVIWYIAVGN